MTNSTDHIEGIPEDEEWEDFDDTDDPDPDQPVEAPAETEGIDEDDPDYTEDVSDVQPDE